MRRVVIEPRKGWEQKVRYDGLTYWDLEGIKWIKDYPCNTTQHILERRRMHHNLSQGFNFLTEKEVMEATFKLHNMCLEVVDRVVNDDVLLTLFEIPQSLWPAVKKSWAEKKTDFMGRFDLAYDATGPPKLLEYNGDTPSVLVESGNVQYNWYRDIAMSAATNTKLMQANFIEKGMISGFNKLKADGRIDPINGLGFVSVEGDEEMKGTVSYLQRVALKCFINTFGCDIKDFSLEYSNGSKYNRATPNLRGKKCEAIFKMYPYEWLVSEMSDKNISEFDSMLAEDLKDIDTIEPAWKLILGNKAILPLLWEMFPGHENLLAAYFIDPKVQIQKNEGDSDDEHIKREEDLSINHWVSKPKYGREGEGIKFSEDYYNYDRFVTETETQTEKAPHMRPHSIQQRHVCWKTDLLFYQETAHLPKA